MNNEKIYEFGRGLVNQLIRFASHFRDSTSSNIRLYNIYLKKTPDEKKLMVSLDPPPYLNYGRHYTKQLRFWVEKIIPIWETEERALSNEIELWANGASDHLYDIEIPKKWKNTKLAKMIKELRDLGLKMGHGFTEQIWTYKDFLKLQNLTKDIAMEIDRKIDVEVADGYD